MRSSFKEKDQSREKMIKMEDTEQRTDRPIGSVLEKAYNTAPGETHNCGSTVVTKYQVKLKLQKVTFSKDI